MPNEDKSSEKLVDIDTSGPGADVDVAETKDQETVDIKEEQSNEETTKNDTSADDTSKKSGGSTNFKINAEIVNGTCPHCNLATVLVCLWHGNIYRCMTCGADLHQHINGKISYLPVITERTPKSQVDRYFDGEES